MCDSCNECKDCQKITGANIQNIETLRGLDTSGCATLEKPDHFICRILSQFGTSIPLYVGSGALVYGNDCKFHALDITADLIHDRLKTLPSDVEKSTSEYLTKDGKWRPISDCKPNRVIASGRAATIADDGCVTRAPSPSAYHKNSPQTFQNGTATVINYDTKQWDSDNNVSIGASWNFKAPVSGIYHVSAATNVEFLDVPNDGSTDPTPNVALQVNINGAMYSKLGQANTSIVNPKVNGVDFARQDYYHVNGDRDVFLNAGDKLDIRVVASMRANATLKILDDMTFAQYNGGQPVNENYFSIHYVGQK